MSELVQKLAQGDHKVIFRPFRDNPLQELRDAIGRNYVHVKFTETRGGTELGFPLDDKSFPNADLEKGEGIIRLSGRLKLDGVPIRVVADIDLQTMEGKGHLEIVEEEPKTAPAS
jgi:hypothetical protein